MASENVKGGIAGWPTTTRQRCSQVFPSLRHELVLFFHLVPASDKPTTALYPTITTAKMSPKGLLLVNLWLITASRGRVTASSMLDKLELVRIPEYFCLLTMWRPSCLRALLASRYSAVRGPHSWGRLLSHRRSQIQSQSRLPWQTHCHILRSSW